MLSGLGEAKSALDVLIRCLTGPGQMLPGGPVWMA